jgi:hypothetical protein
MPAREGVSAAGTADAPAGGRLAAWPAAGVGEVDPAPRGAGEPRHSPRAGQTAGEPAPEDAAVGAIGAAGGVTDAGPAEGAAPGIDGVADDGAAGPERVVPGVGIDDPPALTAVAAEGVIAAGLDRDAPPLVGRAGVTDGAATSLRTTGLSGAVAGSAAPVDTRGVPAIRTAVGGTPAPGRPDPPLSAAAAGLAVVAGPAGGVRRTPAGPGTGVFAGGRAQARRSNDTAGKLACPPGRPRPGELERLGTAALSAPAAAEAPGAGAVTAGLPAGTAPALRVNGGTAPDAARCASPPPSACPGGLPRVAPDRSVLGIASRLVAPSNGPAAATSGIRRTRSSDPVIVEAKRPGTWVSAVSIVRDSDRSPREGRAGADSASPDQACRASPTVADHHRGGATASTAPARRGRNSPVPASWRRISGGLAMPATKRCDAAARLPSGAGRGRPPGGPGLAQRRIAARPSRVRTSPPPGAAGSGTESTASTGTAVTTQSCCW